jgi:hypothetical protein
LSDFFSFVRLSPPAFPIESLQNPHTASVVASFPISISTPMNLEERSPLTPLSVLTFLIAQSTNALLLNGAVRFASWSRNSAWFDAEQPFVPQRKVNSLMPEVS